MKLSSMIPIRYGKGELNLLSREGRRHLQKLPSTVCGLASNFVLELIRSRLARQVMGDRNNYTETTPTESAY
jgi:hypothetical protein